MIDHSAAREELGRIALVAVQGIDEVTVYPGGLDALAHFPAVIVGQPRWAADAGPCMDTSTWPIGVVVARPGGSDTYVQNQLERLWPIVLAGITEAVRADQTLGGVCRASHVQRAEFGLFSIQGQDYPAQTIFTDLYG